MESVKRIIIADMGTEFLVALDVGGNAYLMDNGGHLSLQRGAVVLLRLQVARSQPDSYTGR